MIGQNNPDAGVMLYISDHLNGALTLQRTSTGVMGLCVSDAYTDAPCAMFLDEDDRRALAVELLRGLE